MNDPAVVNLTANRCINKYKCSRESERTPIVASKKACMAYEMYVFRKD